MKSKKGKRTSSTHAKTNKKSEQLDQTKQYKMKKKHKMNPKMKRVLKIIIIIFILLCIVVAGIFAGLFFGLFGDDFKISKADLELSKLSSFAKDRDGNIIATISGEENRQIITLADMPQYLPKAFVSIEDERFYKHHGVDWKRTIGATVQYIFNRGSSSYGGSTITQQLVKNLTNEKDDTGVAGMIRKVKEMAKARQIEKMISKDQILELYLNIIFLGDKAYGVEVASQYYFSKSAKDLSLAESAFLAGINHSPNGYNPFKADTEEEQTKVNEKIKKRTKTVLGKMKELGYINDEEYNTASEQVDTGLAFMQGSVSTSEASYSYHTKAAIEQVKKDLMEQNDWSEAMADFNIRNKGYTIYTTQDTAIQTRMEEEFRKDDTYVRTAKKANADGVKEKSQAAMVIIDHQTGQVVGEVGGLGSDSNAAGLNRGTQSYRQTGSAMKPLAVIAPGLENNTLTAGTVYDDCPTKFGSYEPKNDGRKYLGPITIRDAIETSQNIPELKAMSDLTPSKSIDFLQSIGFSKIHKASEKVYYGSSLIADDNLSLALGGLTIGATPLEMAAGYAMIANDGEYITPTFYTKVEDKDGNVILEAKQEKKQVMSAQNAYILKSILQEPVTGSAGTATYCRISGIDVAAKTGTTNESKDRWLCGFTPYYAAATWYGYDTPSEVTGHSRNPAGRLWSEIMKDIHEEKENKKFEKPSGLVQVTICKDTGLLAGDTCTETYTELFVKGTEPKERCQGQITVRICKETGLLANEYCTDVEEKKYTQKPPKENTTKWQSNYGDEYGNPPTETCTIHTKPEEPPTNTIDNNTTGGGNVIDNNTTGGGNVIDNNTAGGGNIIDDNTAGGGNIIDDNTVT